MRDCTFSYFCFDGDVGLFFLRDYFFFRCAEFVLIIKKYKIIIKKSHKNMSLSVPCP